MPSHYLYIMSHAMREKERERGRDGNETQRETKRCRVWVGGWWVCVTPKGREASKKARTCVRVRNMRSEHAFGTCMRSEHSFGSRKRAGKFFLSRCRTARAGCQQKKGQKEAKPGKEQSKGDANTHTHTPTHTHLRPKTGGQQKRHARRARRCQPPPRRTAGVHDCCGPRRPPAARAGC